MPSPFLFKKKASADRNVAKKMKRFVKARPKFFITMIVATLYFMMVDTNLQQRARLLADHKALTRELLTLDIGGGECDIQSPTEDANPRKENATTTLLASYPGSGKVSSVGFCMLSMILSCLSSPHRLNFLLFIYI
jgi:hypothetical protein